MPIDDSTFKAKFKARKEAYTGDHVKEQLQRAYTSGAKDLYDALAKKFTEEQLYEATAILREHNVE